MTEESRNVAAAMQNVQNHGHIAFNPVEDDIALDREAAKSWPEVIVTPPPCMGMLTQKPETLGDAVYDTTGDVALSLSCAT